MVLLNKTGKITLADNKTNIVLPFEIKDDFKSLKINFEYSPKTLEDKAKEIKIAEDCLEKYGEVQEGNIENYLPIKNLVTVSLDSSREYLGAAHRQSNKQEHIISPGFSSAGFFKTDIAKGEWKAIRSKAELEDVKEWITAESVSEHDVGSELDGITVKGS